jgi:hypothetical protein
LRRKLKQLRELAVGLTEAGFRPAEPGPKAKRRDAHQPAEACLRDAAAAEQLRQAERDRDEPCGNAEADPDQAGATEVRVGDRERRWQYQRDAQS